jgi:hypothetical protein
MKKLMKAISSMLVIVILAGIIVFAFPTGTVNAEELDDDPVDNGQKLGLVKQRLENIFARQQQNLSNQSQRIDKLGEISTRIQERIDTLREKGLDVSSLESALEAFNAEIPLISVSHQVAAGLIAAHEGFGDNGKVTEIKAAGVTVKKAHDALQSTRQKMLEAGKNLRDAFRDFRETNPRKTTP